MESMELGKSNNTKLAKLAKNNNIELTKLAKSNYTELVKKDHIRSVKSKNIKLIK